MIPGPRIVMLGRQGAGKGTQAALLARITCVPRVSAGDMLRSAVRRGTPAGLAAHAAVQADEPVPDAVVVRAVVERLSLPDARLRGWVLDGLPRTVEQAEALVAGCGTDLIDVAIHLEVPETEALERLARRRRPDGRPLAVRERLAAQDADAPSLQAWFDDRNLLVTVDGVGPVEEVAARVWRSVASRLRGPRTTTEPVHAA